ncbi:MAG: cupin domain-containing protein [Thermotaleaceae bacterium]
MIKVNESEREYRFGDSGPKYLRKGPFLSTGVVVFNPGQDFQSHYHKIMEESFLIISGELDFYMNGQLVKCVEGDLITAEPGESHYIVNTSDKVAKAVFMLAPFQLEDKFVVEEKEAQ